MEAYRDQKPRTINNDGEKGCRHGGVTKKSRSARTSLEKGRKTIARLIDEGGEGALLRQTGAPKRARGRNAAT